MNVTSRINEVKQPRGGYVKPSELQENQMNDGITLYEEENIHSSLIGMVVDYLTRFMVVNNANEAFDISLTGAYAAEKNYGQRGFIKVAEYLLNHIQGLDDTSIVSACKLVSFDVWYRNPASAFACRGYDEINPDQQTIANIRTMVNRSLKFIEVYGPITKFGFTFENKGYSRVVNSGDGDFLTANTLWDFKVSKSKPTNKHTLQLLMYYIMGKHSGQSIYTDIENIGIFNPRLNIAYTLEMSKVSAEIIKDIEQNVICY